MNEFLNNVFTAESVNAIKNAHTISPSPEQKEEIRYDTTKMEPTTEDIQEVHTKHVSVPSGISKEELQAVERKLMQEITKQSERISAIINSQNQLIKELHVLQEKSLAASKTQFAAPEPVKETQRSEASGVQKQEVSSKPKNTSQTGAGEGLDPQDYSVEDIFYFGNKK